MRTIAMMVTRNEVNRYLETSLAWLKQQVGLIFVYDDDSTDNTTEIAARYADVVVPKQPSVPSFMEHEGRFRTAALRSLEQVVQPNEDDWIFVADADEFYVPNPQTLHELLTMTQSHHQAIRIRINSVWGIEDGELFHRVDGPWSTLYEPRLWKWREGLAFADLPMACRNEPVFITMNPGLVLSPENVGSAILHYGFASQRDRAHKFKRYSEIEHGHSQHFIDSIMDPRGVYAPWAGEIPSDVR